MGSSMIEGISELNQTFATLEAYGVPFPNWVYVVIILVIVLGAFVYSLDIIFSKFLKFRQFIKISFYNSNIKDSIEVRNSFIGYLEYEVEKLNRESEWNDSLHYTELEAEVEVSKYLDPDLFQSKNPIDWLNYISCWIKTSLGVKPSGKLEKNLTEAVMKSNSQVFIIIGDPGSGKTISLRHMFLQMSKKAKNSKSENVVMPIYLDLKHLDIEPDEINPEKIHNWIIDQLVTGKETNIRKFVDDKFEEMLNKGRFFFLFDSFDEIPSVMDAQEENEIISKYSEAIDRFLHAGSRRRGLVSSRPYRSPRKLDAQRITILPLSNKKIKTALKKYLRSESSLFDRIWNRLLQREDLLHVVRNPFYLSLLTQYCKINRELPERHFDLFEHFVQNRVKADDNKLSYFGFTPDKLIKNAEILAFSMTKTPSIGLKANINQIRDITSDFDKTAGWDSRKVEALLSALIYLKLGRKYDEDTNRPTSFSFVHRRFHEYFCARYLKREYQSAPFEQFNSDNRWREILVLLCEVLPRELLTNIFESSLKSLREGISANFDSKEHRKALETVLFLKDAFKSRIEDVPKDIRIECSNFIKRQFQNENLLNQKRALEGLIIADIDSAHIIIESAFNENSRYLNETAFRSCRALEVIPESILAAIRWNLFLKYTKMEIYKQKNYFSVLFSSSPALKTLNNFLKLLLISTLLQIILIIGVFSYTIKVNSASISSFILGIICFLVVYPFVLSLTYESKSRFNFLKLMLENPLSCFCIFMLLFDLYVHGSDHYTYNHLLWFIPLSLTSLLYAITYFGNISQILIFIEKKSGHFTKMAIIVAFLFFIVESLMYISPHIPQQLTYLLKLILAIVIIYISIIEGLLKIINKLKVHYRERNKINLKSITDLSIDLFLYLGSIAFIFTVLAILPDNVHIIDLNYLEILRALESTFLSVLTAFHHRNYDYLFGIIYSKYNYILASLIVVMDILSILMVLLFGVLSFIGILEYIIFSNIKDQITLYKLSRKIRKYPKIGKYEISTVQALKELNLFRTEIAKTQYIQTLINLLPVDEKNIPLIYDEANKNDGEVRDLLFQLAEIWEDSINNKY